MRAVFVLLLVACSTASERPTPLVVEPEESQSTGAEPSEVHPAGASEVPMAVQVCSNFSFDLRSMPHTGPYEVNEASVTNRVNGMMQSVRNAAAQPPPEIVYFGGSSFDAVFSGAGAMAQCEGARSTVAPTLDGADEELAIHHPRSTPCGPCNQDVLNVLESGE